ESRLKIVGILASGDRSVEELASLLELRAPTVSHHLSRLKKTGLVHMSTEGNTHIYSLNVDSLRTLSKQILSVEELSVDKLVDSEAWEKKVMNDFFEDSRLKVIPASRKKR
ncbi:MAG TPA: metalloregulator ArsR/SmtB family transcription factor, partial [Candidatus Melainabacteria bacterium]|nr:metalloregulator ArsR/SmtB family transcription factor [Candidatus Melainabacteria bacterium]